MAEVDPMMPIFVEAPGRHGADLGAQLVRELIAAGHPQAVEVVVAPAPEGCSDKAAGIHFLSFLLRLRAAPVVLRGFWAMAAACPALPRATWRMLERVALGLGGVVVHPDARLQQYLHLVHFHPFEPEQPLLPYVTTVRLVNHGPGAGAFRPGHVTLLVGDKPNLPRTGQHLFYRVPFLSMHGGGCSRWLADQLEEAWVPESSLYWINASDGAGIGTEHAFIEKLQPRKVIALGAEAAKWCVEARLQGRYDQVPHPQYWKRFGKGEHYPLLDFLPASAHGLRP